MSCNFFIVGECLYRDNDIECVVGKWEMLVENFWVVC